MMASPLLTEAERAQLERARLLLEKIRLARTRDPDDETDPAYHAALASYSLKDFLEAAAESQELSRLEGLLGPTTTETTP